MKTIFTKSLVALALAAAAGNAVAVTVPNTPVNLSAQGFGTADITLGNTDIVLGAEYSLNDVITLTFTGGTVVTTGANPTLVGLNTGGVNMAGFTLGYLNRTANTVTFRVTAINPTTSQTSINGTIRLAGVKFTAASVGASKEVSMAFAAKTNANDVIDSSGTLSGKQIVVRDQFGLTVTKALNAVIDVNTNRKKFTAGNDTTTTDVLTLTPTNNDTDGDAVTVVGSKIEYSLKGDFSFLDQDSNGTVSNGELTAGVVLTGGNATADLALSADKRTVTFTDTVAAATPTAVNATLTLPVAGSAFALNTGAYTADAKVNYTGTATGSTTLSKSAGSWTVNGSIVNVPYMVYGTLSGIQFSQVINVANSSAVEGDITVDVWAEDGTVLLSAEKVGTAKKNSTTNIAGAVREALKTKKSFENGKVSLRVVTNVPDNAVTVYSAYTDVATRERAIVNNDSAVQRKGTVLQ